MLLSASGIRHTGLSLFLKREADGSKGRVRRGIVVWHDVGCGYLGSGQGAAGGWKGIVFGVTAALLYASVVIMNKFLKEIEAVDMTVSQLGVASVVVLAYVLYTEDGTGITFGVSTLFLLLYLGIVNTGIAYLLYFSSLKDLSGHTAALFSYIDPVTAILLSALLFHENMSTEQMIGAVLILGSTLVSELVGGRRQEPANTTGRG